MKAIGTWATGFRFGLMRVTFDPGAGSASVDGADYTNNSVQPGGERSLIVLPEGWSGATDDPGDITDVQFRNDTQSYNITKIEFLVED